VQVRLTWSAATVTPSGGYNIARSTSSTTGFTSIGTVTSSTLTYVDSSSTLVKNTVYYYQITAVGATCTATSSTVSATTVCSNPAVPSPSASADASGNVTVTWTAVGGATAYTVYRSDSSNGTYTAISTGQTAATYTDTASGLTNGSTYYYKVSANNAAGQCSSSQSSATSARACIIPTVPIGVSAMRSGHTRSTLTWTNSSVTTTTYNILRSATSGTGYTSVGISTDSPFTDSTASDGTPYYYVLTARSDSAGNCSSASSAEVSVPSCTVVTGSGGGSAQAQNQTTDICFLTCDKNVAWWTYANPGSRRLYVNTAQVTSSGAMPLPAANNSGYAFYFTATTDGTGNYVYWNYGGATGAACP
jgi:fibronectin type 3 domain-containing protein